MADMTTKEMLTEVNKAIATVLVGGQSYKIGSRQLTRADLGMLRELKNELTVQASEEDNHLFSDTALAVFGGR
jgi:hypothetical protein